MSRCVKMCLGLFVFALISGCAVGNKHSYHETLADIKVTKGLAVAVAVQDQRPYVLSGSKTPTFVGVQRGGFGNPFDINTLSGAALSDDMAESIVRTFIKAGAKASVISVPQSVNKSVLAEGYKEEKAKRIILFTITEWKADTMNNTALIYDMKASVYDSSWILIGESEVSGRDNLGGSAFNPPKHAKKAVPAAFKAKLEELLSDEGIQRSLN
ncbi:hypothetical protein IB229_13255 [Pseudomonas sp. PDM14]|uniref:hypothetical protein n=2 Tax=unclassified Pseudomonas TaxID=196821 RepID=UPI00178267F4|nr:hypothetical protein [Pseudomonas sp. PDM14]MBD9483945.1 hypothetical protein [Pseudomonas sp. PDM14]